MFYVYLMILLSMPFSVIAVPRVGRTAVSRSVSEANKLTSDAPIFERALSAAEFKSDHILITHAVLAVLAWALFAPTAAIILRLNIQSVPLLKIHGWIQLSAYAMYAVAAGLGIWLAIQRQKVLPTWTDPHIIIGLVILGSALCQPFLGLAHHDVFKKRYSTWKADRSAPKPGRTVSGLLHLWIGRVLITLGVINGGLGFRLAKGAPFQSRKSARDGEIAYGVLAGLMWSLYAGVSVLFAYRRTLRLRQERQEEEDQRVLKESSETTPEFDGEKFAKI